MIQYNLSDVKKISAVLQAKRRKRGMNTLCSWQQLVQVLTKMATKNDILTNFVRFLYAFVVLFSLILVAITIHGFYPVIDPISPITFLDKLSYLFGGFGPLYSNRLSSWNVSWTRLWATYSGSYTWNLLTPICKNKTV